jgi:hypothetical protein
MSAEEGKSWRAECQRQWRATSGKIAVTIYLNRLEMDVLDYLAWERLREDPRPEAVGRPFALRSLLYEFADRRRDKISPWAQRAPSSKERASFYHRELGQRRHGRRHGKYEDLPPTEQRQIKQETLSRLNEEERRWMALALMEVQYESEEKDDIAEHEPVQPLRSQSARPRRG